MNNSVTAYWVWVVGQDILFNEGDCPINPAPGINVVHGKGQIFPVQYVYTATYDQTWGVDCLLIGQSEANPQFTAQLEQAGWTRDLPPAKAIYQSLFG